MSNLRQLIECFENERYFPIKGWGKTLLGSDRHIYSNRDGSIGAPALTEYGDVMKSIGWLYEPEDWKPNEGDKDVDAEGWQYAGDFSGFNEPDSKLAESSRSSSIVYMSDPSMTKSDQETLLLMEAVNRDLVVSPKREREEAALRAKDKQESPRELITPVDSYDPSVIVFQGLGSGTKGSLHFVRRRRILRWMVYDPSLLYLGTNPSAWEGTTNLSETSSHASSLIPRDKPRLPCDHCSLKDTERVATMFLTALANATVAAHPRSFDEAKYNVIKTNLIEHLSLTLSPSEMAGTTEVTKEKEGTEDQEGEFEGKKAVDLSVDLADKDGATGNTEADAELVLAGNSSPASTASTSSASSSSSKESLSTPQAGLYQIYAGKLDSFVTQSKSSWSAVSGAFSPSSVLENAGRRTADIAHCFLSANERRLIARLVIRKHDSLFQFHCNKIGCGSECKFCPENCANSGCHVTYSKCDAMEHDAECPQKVISCPRECGDPDIKRRMLSAHMSATCPLRPAPCPFESMGCMAALKAKDVEQHLDDCSTSHSLLLVNRVVEQQTVIKDMHQQMADVNEAGAAQAAALATCVTAINAMKLKHSTDDKAEFEKIANSISAVEGRLQTRITETAKYCTGQVTEEKLRVNTEFKKIAATMTMISNK